MNREVMSVLSDLMIMTEMRNEKIALASRKAIDLIEKQQKEIETLKEDKSFFVKAYTEKIMKED